MEAKQMRLIIKSFSSFFLLLTVQAGCAVRVPPPPAPALAEAPVPPADAVRIATRVLTATGYDVTVSDANAGTIVATRRMRPEDFGADLTCRFPKGSAGSLKGETTLHVTVSIQPHASGSSVQVSTRAETSFAHAGAFASLPTSETDCVSSGAVEKRITAAITG